jgi:phosphatidylglycerol:prolipoprotein diacylglycerol transferase
MIWPNVDQLPRHPSPIYQALVDGLLVFILLWLYSRKQRPRLAVAAMFTLLYGCARIFTEYFRTPDWETSVAGITLSSGQVLSLPMVIAALAMFWWAYRSQARPVR